MSVKIQKFKQRNIKFPKKISLHLCTTRPIVLGGRRRFDHNGLYADETIYTKIHYSLPGFSYYVLYRVTCSGRDSESILLTR